MAGKTPTKRKKKKMVTKTKAKKILSDGSIRGKKLTAKQKRFFGARAGGSPVRRSRHRSAHK